MHFETWQIVCLAVGGGIYLVFEILSIIKNRKAKKAKKLSGPSVVSGEPGRGLSLHIDSTPENEKGGLDE